MTIFILIKMNVNEDNIYDDLKNGYDRSVNIYTKQAKILLYLKSLNAEHFKPTNIGVQTDLLSLQHISYLRYSVKELSI